MTELLSEDQNLQNRTKLSILDIRTLIKLCLSNCYFLWEDKIYQLKDSAPIGLALMVVMAEGFLQYHEKRAIKNTTLSTRPVSYTHLTLPTIYSV